MIDLIVMVSAGAFFIWSMCIISAFGEIMIAKISKVIKRVSHRRKMSDSDIILELLDSMEDK